MTTASVMMSAVRTINDLVGANGHVLGRCIERSQSIPIL